MIISSLYINNNVNPCQRGIRWIALKDLLLKESLTFRSFCSITFWKFRSWWRNLQSSYSATGTLNLWVQTAWVPWSQPRGVPGFSQLCLPHMDLTEGFPASILLQVTVAAITNKYNTPTIQPMESLFLPHLRVQQGVSGQHIYGYTIYHLHDNSRIQVDRGSAITGVFQVNPPLSIPFSQPEMKSIWRSICEFLYSRPGSSHCTYMSLQSQVGFPEASPEVKICL